MPGAKVKHTCPQCGRSMGFISLHICPETPAIIDWLARNLPDQNKPDCIVSLVEYDGLTNPPISSTVLKRTYGTWRKVAARYGLKCREEHPRQKPARKTGGVIGVDPASRAELHRLSLLLHDGRIGPSYSEYDLYAQDVPIKAAGLSHRFGNSWPSVLMAAGLEAGTMSDYKLASNARRKAHQRPQNMRGNWDRGDEPISREFTGIPVLPIPRLLPTGGVAWTVR